jgi:hypothetical protein
MGEYDDIINRERPVSKTHPHMSNHDRAAQFAPFAALTGFGAEIEEMEEKVNAGEPEVIKILYDSRVEKPQKDE